MTKDRKRITVRLPQDLFATLETAAKGFGVTVNAYIVQILRKELKT
ncbi:MAG: type II toxin-antitoxin system HicB family antitoxin [Veillonellaceae bacterium]|nr:type II toxin-antitoxin system HicB family antitoxin [Veillonellaceae bacterium]